MLELKNVSKSYNDGSTEVHALRGVAAVFVTHDAQLASWADRVVFIRDGRTVDQTSPQRPESLPDSTPGGGR